MTTQEPTIQGGVHQVPLGLPQILGLHTQALLSPSLGLWLGLPGLPGVHASFLSLKPCQWRGLGGDGGQVQI